ncbi:endonuclease reverse transcriptase, partial [Pelobates cultripes]
MNKCGRLLANLLKQHRNQLYIPKIKDTYQQLRHLLDQISIAFHDYYQDLFCLRQTNPETQRSQKVEDIRRYLDMANIPGIEEVDQEALEIPITPEELAHTIKKAKTGRSPGPDGKPLQCYKTFAKDLLPKLLKALNSIQDGATPTAQFTS